MLEEHPHFAAPSGLTDDAEAFSPEKRFSPPSFRGHVPDFNAMLSSSDQYLAEHSTNEEPVESSNSYSPFAELGTRSNIPEEPVESLHYQKEPALSFGDIGDIKILLKVK